MDPIKNGNAPAYARPVSAVSEHDAFTGNYEDASQGLTKREAFAMAAMQGLLARNAQLPVKDTPHMVERYAESAVRMADELLAELAKDKTDNIPW